MSLRSIFASNFSDTESGSIVFGPLPKGPICVALENLSSQLAAVSFDLNSVGYHPNFAVRKVGNLNENEARIAIDCKNALLCSVEIRLVEGTPIYKLCVSNGSNEALLKPVVSIDMDGDKLPESLFYKELAKIIKKVTPHEVRVKLRPHYNNLFSGNPQP